MVAYRPELVAQVAWGSGEHDIPAAISPKLWVSDMAGLGNPRLQRPLYSVRLDSHGRVCVLAAGDQPQTASGRALLLSIVPPDGVRRSAVPEGDNDSRQVQVLDFTPDGAGGVYLLELVATTDGRMQNQLRYVDGNGAVQWTRRGAVDHRELDLERLHGKLGYFLVIGGTVFLAALSPQSGLAGLEPGGGVRLVEGFDTDVGRLAGGADGAVYFSHFRDVAGQQRRVVVRRELGDTREGIVPTTIQILDDIAGADAAGSIYVRLSDGFARMARDGSLQWREHVSGLVAASGGRVLYECTRSEPSVPLEIVVWGLADEPERTLVLDLPDELWVTGGQVPTLVGVSGERLYVYGGETPRRAGVLLIYDIDGRLVEREALCGEGFETVNARLLPLESRLGQPSMLQVDERGNMYLPLSDPEGFKIVRWTAYS